MSHCFSVTAAPVVNVDVEDELQFTAQYNRGHTFSCFLRGMHPRVTDRPFC